MLVGLWGLLVCLLNPFPFCGLFGYNLVWVHPSDVGLLVAYPFLFCLVLHVSVSHVSLCMCLITCLPFPSMWRHALLHLSLLCAILFGFLCLFASLHPCLLVHACVFVCLFVSSSLIPTYNLMRAHTCLCTRDPESFWELWLMSHVLSILQSNGTTDTKIQTYICPPRTSFLVCLFDNMLVYSFVCFLSLFALLCAFFISLLSLLLICWFCVFLVVACTRLDRGRNF